MSKQSEALKAAEEALRKAEQELEAVEHAPEAVPGVVHAADTGSVYLGHVGEPAVEGKDF